MAWQASPWKCVRWGLAAVQGTALVLSFVALLVLVFVRMVVLAAVVVVVVVALEVVAIAVVVLVLALEVVLVVGTPIEVTVAQLGKQEAPLVKLGQTRCRSTLARRVVGIVGSVRVVGWSRFAPLHQLEPAQHEQSRVPPRSPIEPECPLNLLPFACCGEIGRAHV